MAIESYFEDIADAIRERGGTSATLTPAAMPQAILDIPGGGSISYETPDYMGLSYGYVASDGVNFIGYKNKTSYVSFFQGIANHKYILFNDSGLGNRRRCGFFGGQTYSTFQDYVENARSGSLPIYSNVTWLAPIVQGTDDTGKGLAAGIVFTCPMAGEFVFMSASNGTTAPVKCLDITEVV